MQINGKLADLFRRHLHRDFGTLAGSFDNAAENFSFAMHCQFTSLIINYTDLCHVYNGTSVQL